MVLEIALDLDQQRPAGQQRPDRVAVDILDVKHVKSVDSAGTSSAGSAPGQQPGLQKCLANPGPASPAACIFAPNRVCRSRTARLPHRPPQGPLSLIIAQCLQQRGAWCRYSLRPFAGRLHGVLQGFVEGAPHRRVAGRSGNTTPLTGALRSS